MYMTRANNIEVRSIDQASQYYRMGTQIRKQHIITGGENIKSSVEFEQNNNSVDDEDKDKSGILNQPSRLWDDSNGHVHCERREGRVMIDRKN